MAAVHQVRNPVTRRVHRKNDEEETCTVRTEIEERSRRLAIAEVINNLR